MQSFTLAAISLMQRKPNFDVKINKVSGPLNIGQGHRVMCVLEGYDKDNYYAKFHTRSYH